MFIRATHEGQPENERRANAADAVQVVTGAVSNVSTSSGTR